MKESVIIQKLIQVGQMLERGELEYSGAEIDTKHYLEQYVALRQPPVSGSLPLFKCKCGYETSNSIAWCIHADCCNGNDR